MDKEKVLQLHNTILEKLQLSLKSETSANDSECLVRSVIGDVILLQAEINKG